MRTIIFSLALIVCAGFAYFYNAGSEEPTNTANDQTLWADVVANYVAIARANYTDSLETAKDMQQQVNAFLEEPSAEGLKELKSAWKHARKYYQQTEVFRFGNPEVDAWEGKVNAWPLDEGLIDYVDTKAYANGSDNPYANMNIIANPVLSLSGKKIDTQDLTAKTLETLHEIDGIESNVATGYHAVEFLLWGQDLNGHKPGAGERPYTDYSKENCTGGNCQRRGKYLTAVTALLVSDLENIVKQWAKEGPIAARFMSEPADVSVGRVITGIGSLSYGELAGERTMLGLLLGDPEEEHDCFSDNTHASHYYNVIGLSNVLNGTYDRLDGTSLKGSGLLTLVEKKSAQQAETLRVAFADTISAADDLVKLAENAQTYDVLIEPGNAKGEKAIRTLVNSLTAQTKQLELAANALGLSGVVFETSDSLEKK